LGLERGVPRPHELRQRSVRLRAGAAVLRERLRLWGRDVQRLRLRSRLGTGRQYDASGTYCSVDADRRDMLHTQPDVEGTLGCAANVGTYGCTGEKPTLAMSAALSPEHNVADGRRASRRSR